VRYQIFFTFLHYIFRYNTVSRSWKCCGFQSVDGSLCRPHTFSSVVLVPACLSVSSSWRKDFQSNASIDDVAGYGGHLPPSRHAPRNSSAVNICRAASGSRRRGRSRSDGHLLFAGGVTDSSIVTLRDEWQSKEQTDVRGGWALVGSASGEMKDAPKYINN